MRQRTCCDRTPADFKPSSVNCRKAKCKELGEYKDGSGRKQMRCKITDTIPGNMLTCPKGVSNHVSVIKKFP